MRLVLTHAYFLNDDPKEQAIMRPYPTLGLLYISAWLKKHGYSPEVVDSTFITREQWRERITAAQPDVIACYSNLMTKVPLLRLIKEIRSELPETTFVVGGPDVTYNIENYLKAGFDVAVSGEGEETMLELVQAIENKASLASIQGISYLDQGILKTNPPRDKIREMSTLPFPDRDAIPLEKYLNTWKEHHGQRTLNISTQRGCPYTCKWCSTAVYGQSYRRNAPERVVEEILELKERYDVEALWFVDDVFTVSHKWIANLHEAFRKANLVIPFECITRAERLNDTVLQQLKEMGCFRIWIGAESGSQRIIDKMDRRVQLEQVQQMIRRTRELGMESGTFLMVGYPGETNEDVRRTMEHIRKANPNLLTITKAYPIKGTALYEEVKSELVLPDWESSTDREIHLPAPYSDRYYRNAVRYLMNGWQAMNQPSLMPALKSKLSYFLMQCNKVLG